MSKKDYMETLKDSVGVVGKFASKSLTQIQKGLKGEKEEEIFSRTTGLFFQRHIQPIFGNMIPRLEFSESVSHNRLKSGFVKKLIQSTADKAFASACFSIIFGDLNQSLEKLNEVAVADPQYTDGYFLQGLIYMNQGKFDRAEDNFSKCRLLAVNMGEKLKKFMPTLKGTICITENISLNFYPDIPGLNMLLALAQRNWGDLKKAIITTEQVLSVMPDCQELSLLLALLYHEACWDDKITEQFKDMLPENNLQLLIIQFLVRAWINKQNTGIAEGILQKALEASDIDPIIQADIKMIFAEISRKSGRMSESNAYSSKVKQTYPNYQDLSTRLGLKRLPQPLPKDPPLAPAQPIMTGAGMTVRMDEPPVSPQARTVLVSPDAQPRELTGVEPGKIVLKSRDGRVNMVLPESVTIGRESGDIVMNWDASASRTHARILMDKGQIWVEDLGSSNGTWINQTRITNRRAFNKGDNLLVGKTEFYLE